LSVAGLVASLSRGCHVEQAAWRRGQWRPAGCFELWLGVHRARCTAGVERATRGGGGSLVHQGSSAACCRGLVGAPARSRRGTVATSCGVRKCSTWNRGGRSGAGSKPASRSRQPAGSTAGAHTPRRARWHNAAPDGRTGGSGTAGEATLGGTEPSSSQRLVRLGLLRDAAEGGDSPSFQVFAGACWERSSGWLGGSFLLGPAAAMGRSGRVLVRSGRALARADTHCARALNP